MPYIEPENRESLNEFLNHLRYMIDSPGELNYAITKLIHDYIGHVKPCYASINEAIGALECAKLELYRVVAGPYENIKRRENGPVSELDDDSHERMR